VEQCRNKKLRVTEGKFSYLEFAVVQRWLFILRHVAEEVERRVALVVCDVDVRRCDVVWIKSAPAPACIRLGDAPESTNSFRMGMLKSVQ
jgi:hypothetical protein